MTYTVTYKEVPVPEEGCSECAFISGLGCYAPGKISTFCWNNKTIWKKVKEDISDSKRSDIRTD